MELEELNSRLDKLEEYSSLTELNKKILITHFENPKLNQTEVSNLIDCSRITVNRFYNSKEFEILTKELGEVKKIELVALSLKTLEECLNSKSDQIRLAASLKILGDVGILKDSPKIDNSKKIIHLEWKKENADNSILPPRLSVSST
mgnify:FL=1